MVTIRFSHSTLQLISQISSLGILVYFVSVTTALSLKVLQRSESHDNHDHHHQEKHDHKTGICELPHYGEDPETTKKLVMLEDKLAQELSKLISNTTGNHDFNLINIEGLCYKHLSKYLKEYNEDVVAIEKDAKTAQGGVAPATKAEIVIENPIFTLKMIRRMVITLLKKTVNECKGKEKVVGNMVSNAFEGAGLVPPMQKELERSLQGLLILGFVYGLNASSELRTGKLKNVQSSAQLKYEDCFAVADAFMDHDEDGIMLYHWLEAAATALSCEGENAEPESKAELELAWKRLQNITGFKTVEEMHRNMGGVPLTKLKDTSYEYENLCRGEMDYNMLPADFDFPMDHPFCKIVSPPPHFYLNPLKIEVISDYPMMLQFHDFLTDIEINFIRKSPTTMVRTSSVGKRENFKSLKEYDLKVKEMLHDIVHETNDHPIMVNLVTKVEAATKLNVNRDEASIFELGLYTPLSQYWNVEQSRETLVAYDSTQENQQFATFLMFLTEPRVGGYYTFPKMNIFVEPIKKSALLFFNYKFVKGMKLKPEKRMFHESCPVVMGIKEVANMPLNQPAKSEIGPFFS